MKISVVTSRKLVSKACVIVGAVCLTLIVLTTVYESMARRLGIIFYGRIELTSFLEVIILWMAIAYTEIARGHVTVKFLLDRLRPFPLFVVEVTISVLILAMCLLAVWPGLQETIYAWNRHLRSDMLGWPLWIPNLAVPIGFLAFGFLQVIRIRELVRNRHQIKEIMAKRASGMGEI